MNFRLLFLPLFLMLAFSAPAQQDADLGTLSAAFPELKIQQESGLPIRYAREDWQQAKQKVAFDAGWARWLSSHRAALDKWIGQPREKGEWVAGYGSDLVDPSSQLPLRWSVDMPEPQAEKSVNSKLHSAWVFKVRTHNIAQILEAARLYRLTGETRYAEWAANQLDFYAQHFSGWPLRSYGGKARLMAQGLDDATSAVTLVPAVRLLKGFVDEERCGRWRDQLFLPIAANLSNTPNNVDNIRLWQDSAVALIGMEFGNEALVQDSLYGSKGVRNILRQGVTTDSLWLEGSLGYQTYVLRALVPLFIEAALHGRGQELEREMLLAQNMLLSPVALRFDDGTLPNPSDSNVRLKAIDIGLHMDLYRALPTRISLIEAQRGKSWETLIDAPATTQELSSVRLPNVVSRHLEGSRMAVLRSGPWQVFLNYGQLSPNHAQPEALNTEIYFGGTQISIDPGTVSYGSKLHTGYFSKAVSQNVALVDGDGQQGWDKGQMRRFDALAPSLLASQPRYRKDASSEREILFSGGDLVDRQTLRLNPETKGTRRLGFLFHTGCELVPAETSAGPSEKATAPVGAGFDYWRNVEVRHPTSTWEARIDCGKQAFNARFSVGEKHRFFTAKAPATPVPATRNVLYVELDGSEATLEMRLSPVPSKSQVPGGEIY